jgi:hypothetical protein
MDENAFPSREIDLPHEVLDLRLSIRRLTQRIEALEEVLGVAQQTGMAAGPHRDPSPHAELLSTQADRERVEELRKRVWEEPRP